MAIYGQDTLEFQKQFLQINWLGNVDSPHGLFTHVARWMRRYEQLRRTWIEAFKPGKNINAIHTMSEFRVSNNTIEALGI